MGVKLQRYGSERDSNLEAFAGYSDTVEIVAFEIALSVPSHSGEVAVMATSWRKRIPAVGL